MPPYKYTDYSCVRVSSSLNSAAGSKALSPAALYAAEHHRQPGASRSAPLAAVNHTGSAGTNAIPTISAPKHAHIHTHLHPPNANANNAPPPHILDHYVIRDIRKQVLPVKLSRMLSDPNFSDIISWMPHGRAWKVLRPRDFTERVAPIYFEYPNYNSFIRLVNAWGFRRITTGVDTNAYFHELFLRDMPHLHKMMRRLGKNEKKTLLNPSQEPDFYKMPPLPLPLPLQLQSLLRNGNANAVSKNVVRTLEQTLGGGSFSHGQGHGLENGPRRALPPATTASSGLLERLLGATGGGGRGYPCSSSSVSNAATTAKALQMLQKLSSSYTSYSTNALAPNNTSTSAGITTDDVYRTILDTISTTKGQPPMNSSTVEELAAVLGLNGSANSTSSSSLLSSSGIGRGVGSMMGIGNGMGNGNGPTSSSLLPSEHDTFSTTTTNPQILRLLQSSSLPLSSSSTRPSEGAGANVPSAPSICSSILSSLHPQNASSSSSGTSSTTYAELLQLQAQLQMQAEQQQQKKEQEQQGLLYLKNQHQQQQQQQQNHIVALKNILQQQARNENLNRLYRHEGQHHLQTTGILQQQQQQQQTIEDLISIPGGGVRGGGTNMLTNVHVGPTTTSTGGVLPSALPGLSIASPPVGPLRHAGSVGPVPPVHLPVVSTATSSASSIGTAASMNQMSPCSTSTSGSGPNVSPSAHLARFAA